MGSFKTAFLSISSIIALAACATTPNLASNTPSGDLVLRASGTGQWQVECEADTVRGNTAKAKIRNKGSRNSDVIIVQGTTKASCSFSTQSAPLILKLDEKGLDCPFSAYENGVCETVLAADQSGTLELMPVE